MPQECMSVNVSLTDCEVQTLSPVIGQNPPLASVAANTAPESLVTSTEQSCNTDIDYHWSHVLYHES